eukprot:2540851-Rhodomonas_salina.1
MALITVATPLVAAGHQHSNWAVLAQQSSVWDIAVSELAFGFVFPTRSAAFRGHSLPVAAAGAQHAGPLGVPRVKMGVY